MKKLDYLNQHSRPVTRRDFISRGLCAGAGTVMAPTVLGWLGQNLAFSEARAAEAATAPKFITFDCAGGAALFANFLVGGAGGAIDLLPTYDKLGWNPKATGALDSRFGLPMATKESKILAGILGATSPEAQAGLRFGSLLHIGQIDTSENPLSILSLIDSSRLSTGSLIEGALGLNQTPSGGISKPLLDLTGNRPYFVRDLPTLISAVGLGGEYMKYGDIDRRRVAKLMGRLSSSQLGTFLNGGLTQAAHDYLSTSFKQMEGKATTTTALDPRLNPDFQQLYGIAPGSDGTATNVLRAALVMNTLAGNTGPSVITIQGCDYHDGTQTTGDAKDLEIGTEIGRAVEAAKRLKVPLFIHVITDGGIYPDPGTRVWRGDSVETSMSVLGYYHPTQAPQYHVAGRVQIGAYTSNQGADRSTLIGANPALAANAALANYLSIAGKLDLLSTIYPQSIPANQLEQTLIFG